MQRKIKFSEGEYYHIYNRGVEKRNIFLDDYDYNRFVFLLFCSNDIKPFSYRDLKELKPRGLPSGKIKNNLVNIGAFCLMPNHFHLLIKETVEGGISKFMLKLSTAYTMYFNKKYERSGALFQGTFKAEHVDFDEYLKYLFSYIHLNPIKLIQSDWKDRGIEDIIKAKKYLNDYKYSSFIDYIGVKREENNILNKEAFPEYFESREDFENNIFDWLDYNNFNPEGNPRG